MSSWELQQITDMLYVREIDENSCVNCYWCFYLHVSLFGLHVTDTVGREELDIAIHTICKLYWVGMGITFPRPTAIGPRPPALFTFLRPLAQTTFSQPLMIELLFHGPLAPSIKNYLFTALVTTKVCHVFFYFLK